MFTENFDIILQESFRFFRPQFCPLHRFSSSFLHELCKLSRCFQIYSQKLIDNMAAITNNFMTRFWKSFHATCNFRLRCLTPPTHLLYFWCVIQNILSENLFFSGWFQKTNTNPSWSTTDIQRWTALFQRFDVFQRCSALIQRTR